MSDIWGLSEGGSAADTGTEYEVPGGGNFDALPEGSKVLAMVEDADWKEDKDGNEYLNLKWSVVKPEDVANRKIFQKLWISDLDPRSHGDKAEKKRDRARRLFAAIDANAGGKLAKKGGKPSGEDIAIALSNKLMVIRLGLWEMEDNQNPGQMMQGNWVQAVSPKASEIGIPDVKPKAQSARAGGTQRSQSSNRNDFDDEIPF